MSIICRHLELDCNVSNNCLSIRHNCQFIMNSNSFRASSLRIILYFVLGDIFTNEPGFATLKPLETYYLLVHNFSYCYYIFLNIL